MSSKYIDASNQGEGLSRTSLPPTVDSSPIASQSLIESRYHILQRGSRSMVDSINNTHRYNVHSPPEPFDKGSNYSIYGYPIFSECLASVHYKYDLFSRTCIFL